MQPIPYGRQEITDEDIAAVVAALQSDYLTQGPLIKSFETAFAEYTGAKYAVALSNGTAALHLSVMALGLQKDEYVICTPLTFAASVNCVKYCGGNVLFADIDPETYLMDLDHAAALIASNPDKKIVGIIPVDFAGRVVDLNAFRDFANSNNLWLLEDACHAPGGYHQSKMQSAGGGIADLSIFSFHPVKHIATGEGGMITTNSEELYEKLLVLRTHGITRNTEHFQNSVELANGNALQHHEDYPGWYMEMQELGYNYRITDFQSALGISQLKRADKNLSKRKEIAKKYVDALTGQKGMIRVQPFNEGNAYHLMVLEVEDRRGLYDYLRSKNIFCQIHYFPVHLMPYYRQFGWKESDLPMVEQYYSQCISVPMFPTLPIKDVEAIIQMIKSYYNPS
jgi:UDP-4-amino-4,6-dideoxy-N-acetyl-beta-L-altrosamine transaminase